MVFTKWTSRLSLALAAFASAGLFGCDDDTASSASDATILEHDASHGGSGGTIGTECTDASDCNDAGKCQTAICKEGTCRYMQQPSDVCCMDANDCPQGGTCQSAVCSDEGVCSLVDVDNCCMRPSDCQGETSDACHEWACGANRCVEVKKDNCCLTADECPTGNVCQTAVCEDHTCALTTDTTCCVSSETCPTSDSCHLAICSNNLCSEVAISDCTPCQTAEDCNAGSCQRATCDQNVCHYSEVAGCCTGDEQCSGTTTACERNVCVFDSEGAVEGTCGTEEIFEGCTVCNRTTQCPEKPCSIAACTDSICHYTPKDDCEICDADNPCVADPCGAPVVCGAKGECEYETVENVAANECCSFASLCADGLECQISSTETEGGDLKGNDPSLVGRCAYVYNQVDFCEIIATQQGPFAIASEDISVRVSIRESSVVAAGGLIVEAAFGEAGEATPDGEPNFVVTSDSVSWTRLAEDSESSANSNSALEFVGTLPTAGHVEKGTTYEYAARVSLDGGNAFVFCDTKFVTSEAAGETAAVEGVYRSDEAATFEVVDCFNTTDSENAVTMHGCEGDAGSCLRYVCNSENTCETESIEKCCSETVSCEAPDPMLCQQLASDASETNCVLTENERDGVCADFARIEDCCIETSECEAAACNTVECALVEESSAYRTCIQTWKSGCCLVATDCLPSSERLVARCDLAEGATEGACNYELSEGFCRDDELANCSKTLDCQAIVCNDKDESNVGVCGVAMGECEECMSNDGCVTPDKSQCQALEGATCDNAGVCNYTRQSNCCVDVSECYAGRACEVPVCNGDDGDYKVCGVNSDACVSNEEDCAQNAIDSRLDSMMLMSFSLNENTGFCEYDLCNFCEADEANESVCEEFSWGSCADSCARPIESCEVVFNPAHSFYYVGSTVDGEFYNVSTDVSVVIRESSTCAGDDILSRVRAFAGFVDGTSESSWISSAVYFELSGENCNAQGCEFSVSDSVSDWLAVGERQLWQTEEDFVTGLAVVASADNGKTYTLCNMPVADYLDGKAHCVERDGLACEFDMNEAAQAIYSYEMRSTASDATIETASSTNDAVGALAAGHFYANDTTIHTFKAKLSIENLTDLSDGLNQIGALEGLTTGNELKVELGMGASADSLNWIEAVGVSAESVNGYDIYTVADTIEALSNIGDLSEVSSLVYQWKVTFFDKTFTSELSTLTRKANPNPIYCIVGSTSCGDEQTVVSETGNVVLDKGRWICETEFKGRCSSSQICSNGACGNRCVENMQVCVDDKPSYLTGFVGETDSECASKSYSDTKCSDLSPTSICEVANGRASCVEKCEGFTCNTESTVCTSNGKLAHYSGAVALVDGECTCVVDEEHATECEDDDTGAQKCEGGACVSQCATSCEAKSVCDDEALFVYSGKCGFGGECDYTVEYAPDDSGRYFCDSGAWNDVCSAVQCEAESLHCSDDATSYVKFTGEVVFEDGNCKCEIDESNNCDEGQICVEGELTECKSSSEVCGADEEVEVEACNGETKLKKVVHRKHFFDAEIAACSTVDSDTDAEPEILGECEGSETCVLEDGVATCVENLCAASVKPADSYSCGVDENGNAVSLLVVATECDPKTGEWATETTVAAKCAKTAFCSGDNLVATSDSCDELTGHCAASETIDCTTQNTESSCDGDTIVTYTGTCFTSKLGKASCGVVEVERIECTGEQVSCDASDETGKTLLTQKMSCVPGQTECQLSEAQVTTCADEVSCEPADVESTKLLTKRGFCQAGEKGASCQVSDEPSELDCSENVDAPTCEGSSIISYRGVCSEEAGVPACKSVANDPVLCEGEESSCDADGVKVQKFSLSCEPGMLECQKIESEVVDCQAEIPASVCEGESLTLQTGVCAQGKGNSAYCEASVVEVKTCAGEVLSCDADGKTLITETLSCVAGELDCHSEQLNAQDCGLEIEASRCDGSELVTSEGVCQLGEGGTAACMAREITREDCSQMIKDSACDDNSLVTYAGICEQVDSQAACNFIEDSRTNCEGNELTCSDDAQSVLSRHQECVPGSTECTWSDYELYDNCSARSEPATCEGNDLVTRRYVCSLRSGMADCEMQEDRLNCEMEGIERPSECSGNTFVTFLRGCDAGNNACTSDIISESWDCGDDVCDPNGGCVPSEENIENF